MQIELSPEDPTSKSNGQWSKSGAIPPRLRDFGWVVDTSLLKPADLILVREKEQDSVAHGIVSAQKKGGYHDIDARWTHAAMYLGDGLNLCEATFSLSPWEKRGVIVTPIWEYCGEHYIRIRRPALLLTDDDRWLVVIKALTNLRKDYDFRYVLNLAFDALLGRGYWSTEMSAQIRPSALVCSTLYADAYTRHTGKVLGERENGHCTPAYLSQSSIFQDIECFWCKLE